MLNLQTLVTIVSLALGLASHTLGAVLTSSIERVATDKAALHVNGIDVNVGTISVPESHIDRLINATLRVRSPHPETTLTKRTVNNCCSYGCRRTCVDGLSTSPDPPTSGDCAALKSALEALAASELVGASFPCNLPNQASCPNFIVSPGYERAYWYGTCLVGFINLNPTGGADESYCDYLMAGIITSSYDECVATQGKTGGYCLQYLSPGFVYALE
ncbi:hypothetical protein PC9H_011022 [Pleurotus ostreatus]|uniref:Uncharacterized protein n=1 Tax=Pleurotus ostreatus TaxID=5322 RepID=A0A8H6ZNW1_PLEOS|nr:uncharacterized protein PC9H_011022 [Pleurotus ostreatus]KAF7422859.1 hypothetical protein PC9H_011022 [Pleurotus ostreatus]